MAVNKIGEWEFSEEEFLKELEEATRRGEESLEKEPRAESIKFDEEENLIMLRLNSGCVFGFPPDLIKELQNAEPNEIAQAELTPLGTGVFWENLDADYTVTGLLNGIFGTKAWMKELGRSGGRRKSEAKAEAARINGAKGGRPKKQTGEHHLNIRLEKHSFLPSPESNAFQVLAAKVVSSATPIKKLEETKSYLEEPVKQQNKSVIGARILSFHKKMETNLTVKNIRVSELEEEYASESIAA